MFENQLALAAFPPGFNEWPQNEQVAYRETMGRILEILLKSVLTASMMNLQTSRPIAQAFMTTAATIAMTAPTPELKMELLTHFENSVRGDEALQ